MTAEPTQRPLALRGSDSITYGGHTRPRVFRPTPSLVPCPLLTLPVHLIRLTPASPHPMRKRECEAEKERPVCARLPHLSLFEAKREYGARTGLSEGLGSSPDKEFFSRAMCIQQCELRQGAFREK